MSRDERLAAFAEGCKVALPLLFAAAPWGIITGAAMVGVGLTPAQAIGMSLFVYAGSVQLALIPLLAVKAPVWVILVTALVVNSRYFIYSASVAPHFSHLPMRWRVLLSYLTVDGLFALFIVRFKTQDRGPRKHWYYFGAGTILCGCWQVSTWIGVFGGSFIPKSWSAEFAATLALIALAIPLLYDRAVVCGALAAAAVALAAAGLPFNTGLLVAAAAGVAAGMAAARLLPQRKAA